MMDHIANNEINQAFRLNYARIPLKDSAHILHGDALEANWSALLPPEKCSYIMGNPPFIGAKFQSAEQRAQVRRIANLGGSGGTLDYVAAWFIKAGQHITVNPRIRVAFVSTNSITQGEQVAQLWPILFDRHKLEIAFAHRTFSWGSEARGKAQVHVVIVGLAHRDHQPAAKRLFSYPDIDSGPVESEHSALTAYLFDAKSVANRHLVIPSTSKPINGASKLITGSKPVDGGYLILTNEERRTVVEQEPQILDLIRPFIGASEYINEGQRWILALQQVAPDRLRGSPFIKARLERVRQFRQGEVSPKGKPAGARPTPGSSTSSLSSTPTSFHVTVIPETPFLVIPQVSSERRQYAPIGWLEPPTIPSDKLRLLADATLWDFGILTSNIHMAWMRSITGRMKSDYMYSVGVVYNTFPWPDASPAKRTKVETLAQAVLDARAAHPTSSLADLYDPDTMPADLRRAHNALDKAVDRLYRPAPFKTDRDRVEHLFGRYEALVNPLESIGAAKNKRVQRKATARKG